MSGLIPTGYFEVVPQVFIKSVVLSVTVIFDLVIFSIVSKGTIHSNYFITMNETNRI